MKATYKIWCKWHNLCHGRETSMSERAVRDWDEYELVLVIQNDGSWIKLDRIV